jgi:hypothetical protein
VVVSGMEENMKESPAQLFQLTAVSLFETICKIITNLNLCHGSHYDELDDVLQSKYFLL